MPLYRKKPVEIQAVQWDGLNASVIRDHFDSYSDWSFKGDEIKIVTLEGTMTASPGDFIIKGVNGEFYPCKPDIFAKTYNKVE